VFGSRGEAQRRYVYSETERTDPGHLTVSLSSLGYDGSGVLVFRDDTDEFKVASGNLVPSRTEATRFRSG
jgi:hypothetical protein